MREALAARSGRDFTVTGAAMRQAPARPGAGARGVGAAVAAAFALAVRHRGILARGGLVVGAAAAVGLNALSWQTARHPAPMFAPKAESGASKRLDQPRPVPPPRPAVAAPPAAAPVPAVPPVRPASSARDPLADAIRASETGALGKSESQRVAAAQRALTKLNLGPLKADGVMGAGTKAAIERFERSRGLPPTGDLGPRTARELAAQAGMAIE